MKHDPTVSRWAERYVEPIEGEVVTDSQTETQDQRIARDWQTVVTSARRLAFIILGAAITFTAAGMMAAWPLALPLGAFGLWIIWRNTTERYSRPTDTG